MNNINFKALSLMMAGAALMTASADAAIVNVDITAAPGTGPTGFNLPGVIGDQSAPQWNPVTDQSLYSGLIDEDGVATGFSFQLNAPEIDGFSNGGANNHFFKSYAWLASGDDSQQQGAFTIGGLDNSKIYNLYFYATWEWINAGSEFSVDGGATWKLSDGVPSESNAAFTEGSSYVKFEGVAPTAGEIDGLWRSTVAGDSTVHRGMFNGVQIEEVVPEPGSLALLGLGGLLIGARRRRG